MEMEYKQHYHMVYEKKLPHGVARVEVTLLTPRDEISEAFAAVNEILKNDLQCHTEETCASKQVRTESTVS